MKLLLISLIFISTYAGTLTLKFTPKKTRTVQKNIESYLGIIQINLKYSNKDCSLKVKDLLAINIRPQIESILRESRDGVKSPSEDKIMQYSTLVRMYIAIVAFSMEDKCKCYTQMGQKGIGECDKQYDQLYQHNMRKYKRYSKLYLESYNTYSTGVNNLLNQGEERLGDKYNETLLKVIHSKAIYDCLNNVYTSSSVDMEDRYQGCIVYEYEFGPELAGKFMKLHYEVQYKKEHPDLPIDVLKKQINKGLSKLEKKKLNLQEIYFNLEREFLLHEIFVKRKDLGLSLMKRNNRLQEWQMQEVLARTVHGYDTTYYNEIREIIKDTKGIILFGKESKANKIKELKRITLESLKSDLNNYYFNSNTRHHSIE